MKRLLLIALAIALVLTLTICSIAFAHPHPKVPLDFVHPKDGGSIIKGQTIHVILTCDTVSEYSMKFQYNEGNGWINFDDVQMDGNVVRGVYIPSENQGNFVQFYFWNGFMCTPEIPCQLWISVDVKEVGQ